MHKLQILHRDLKPANLIVRELAPPDIVVLDLGLSFDNTGKLTRLTRVGETIKNELFALPEGLTRNADRTDYRSNHEHCWRALLCLTGQLPVQLRDQHDLAPHQRSGCRVQEVLKGDARARQVELLFDSGFAVDIEGRFQTIDELRARLSQIVIPSRAAKRSPEQAAAEVSARMRAQNRKLQVQEYVPCAKRTNDKIHEYLASKHEKLGFFSVHFASYGGIDLPLPSGYDHVFSFTFDFVTSLETAELSNVTRMCMRRRVIDACSCTPASRIVRGEDRSSIRRKNGWKWLGLIRQIRLMTETFRIGSTIYWSARLKNSNGRPANLLGTESTLSGVGSSWTTREHSLRLSQLRDQVP